MTLTVRALWRYPVKTLAGERLDVAELTTNGIVGDRIVHVRGPEGVRTSRRHHNLIGLHAELGPDGDPRRRAALGLAGGARACSRRSRTRRDARPLRRP